MRESGLKFLYVAALATMAFSIADAATAAPADAPPAARHNLTAQDASAFLDAKVAELKAVLQLTPAQEANWPAVEVAMRDIAKDRLARAQTRKDEEKEHKNHADFLKILQNRADMLRVRAGEIEKFALAAKPLYDSLDDAQQHRFSIILRQFEQRQHKPPFPPPHSR